MTADDESCVDKTGIEEKNDLWCEVSAAEQNMNWEGKSMKWCVQ